MRKYWKYFKTICRHKWYVFVECYKQGIIWQGIVHDMSKFSPQEFFASARYYNGDGNDYEYQKAWLHHKGHNKHHWEYWTDWNSSSERMITTKIPVKYLKEMYADIIGASKAYNRTSFCKGEPYDYFVNKEHAVMNPDSYNWIRDKLENFKNS